MQVSLGSMTTLCSDLQHEPMPGTAKPGQCFIAMEHPYGWGHDILDGHALGDELSAQITEYLSHHNSQMQLIRRPGREGQHVDRRTVFISDVRGTIRKLYVEKPEDLLAIDPANSGGEIVNHPIILVCTHGKRDQCCALKGRPIAAALDEEFGELIWESSHTKGHRFAPSIITLPWGYSYGRLNESAATEMVRHVQRGSLFLPGCRGRSVWNPRGQVAELAVAAQLVDVKMGDLTVDDDIVQHADGRQWRVTLEQREVDGVISSCGDAPKTGKAWVAVSVESLA